MMHFHCSNPDCKKQLGAYLKDPFGVPGAWRAYDPHGNKLFLSACSLGCLDQAQRIAKKTHNFRIMWTYHETEIEAKHQLDEAHQIEDLVKQAAALLHVGTDKLIDAIQGQLKTNNELKRQVTELEKKVVTTTDKEGTDDHS